MRNIVLSLSTLFLISSERFTEKVEVRCFDLVITRTAGQWILVDNIRYRLSAPQNASCWRAAFVYWLVVTSDAVRLSTGLQYVHGLSHSTKMLQQLPLLTDLRTDNQQSITDHHHFLFCVYLYWKMLFCSIIALSVIMTVIVKYRQIEYTKREKSITLFLLLQSYITH